MNCKQAKDLIFAYVKGELDEKTRLEMQSHLDVCENCRRELAEVTAVLALVESASDEKVIALVNGTILRGIEKGASDIHLEAEPDGFRIRIRCDGVLQDLARLPGESRQAVTARIKMLADMNVSERRIPQDGRITSNQISGINRELDIRVSCVPSIHGESFAMRILDQSNVLLGLDRLEISAEQLGKIRGLVRRQKGWIIGTGPSGSGITTLLYSMLLETDREEQKVVTIEDPVEIALKGVTQIPVFKKAGLTFATGLRSILRHDPDVIMVGAIRDLECAETAVEAAIAGIFVLSALLTNDAPSALIRLVDIGLEPFLVASAVSGIVAQRLVRKVCGDCREEYTPDPEALRVLGFTLQDIAGTKFYHGRGCDKCGGKGYAGRTPIDEVLEMNGEIAGLLNRRAPLIDIRRSAIESGMVTMASDARRKIAEGITTAEEAARVLGTDPVI